MLIIVTNIVISGATVLKVGLEKFSESSSSSSSSSSPAESIVNKIGVAASTSQASPEVTTQMILSRTYV